MYPTKDPSLSLASLVLSVCVCITGRLQAVEEDPHPETLRVMSYYTWYVFAKGKEQSAGKKWVHSQSPDVVALQELTNTEPEKLQELAAAWGHAHSSLLKSSGFSVGLTSRWEIEVNYGVLEKFLNHGLHDTASGHLSESAEHRLSIPTGVWGDKVTAVKEGDRIDFILSSMNQFRKVTADFGRMPNLRVPPISLAASPAPNLNDCSSVRLKMVPQIL